MNKKKVCACAVLVSLSGYAKMDNPALMSARDIEQDTLSNITLINRTHQTITASGLFIASYDINDCSACFGNVVSGDNVGGSIASFVTFKPQQEVPIGQNFLYNMIYNGIYFIQTTIGSSPCLLPGCSWPGDTPNTTWCLTINATSLDTNYTRSMFKNGNNPPAKIPAYGASGNSVFFDYRYDLIDPSKLGTGNACLGPVSCDDKNLTCKVSAAQNEVIEIYH
jgi:hypothetical protein